MSALTDERGAGADDPSPAFGRGLLIVLVGQMIFWLVLLGAESLARPPGMQTPANVDLHLTSDGSLETSFDRVELPLVRQPGYFYRDPAGGEQGEPRIGVFDLSFEADDPEEASGLFLGWSYRIDVVRLNGQALKPHTALDAWGEVTGFTPSVYAFPEELVRPGRNELTVRVSGELTKRLPVFQVGRLDELLRAQVWGRVFTTDLVIVSVAVMALMLVLCFLVNWPAEDRPRIHSLAILLGMWSLRNLQMLGLDRYLSEPVAWWAYTAVTYALIVALADFALAWTGLLPRLRARRAWAYLAATLLPTILILTGLRHIQETDTGWMIEIALTLIVCPLVIGLFATYYARRRRGETIEILLFIVCATSLMIDAADDRFELVVPFSDNLFLTFYTAPMSGLLLGLGMCASIAAQATRARRVVMQANEILEQKLAQREQEIRNHAKENAIVDERRRIMRDMHDGLGASLSSLIMRLRAKQLAYEDAPQAVQSALDELRLVVDSLDSAGDTLAIALGAFRERIEDHFRSADVELDWEVESRAASAEYGAADVLQIYRIMQEACINALRHGDPKRIAISLTASPDAPGFPYQIIVEDDGRGLPENMRESGKGLANMRMRATRIGARLSLEEANPGLRVRLLLPDPEA